ncbi:hypothetical protein LTR10_015489 [Elasticomyces elasticus]|uniref:Diphthine--ammonia ligase n=1 Tax=Exophiala sideris TaxID=1016849 RepID=A0ABR0J3Y1_9EURO|nr:hypothetical protein LTR10_015489 [Elasticomyces elasticus]KAK5026919.1 hypothetical protein LTS07_007218 [Exophiala sideris]KAK5033923.1 hypothetical protein LTR13_006523 [Exophiala sideris]KAK5055802.1 hypothetical protein LTR69_008177 [Exophiala sideris]KAK5180865.1 hypothetical protein LTR44_006685 [Eurotiomycetes sp. CCFEE 6388]
MSESLKVIALISGGKDSLFSILHCFKNGHKVVALANLYPKPPEGHAHTTGSPSNDEIEGEGEDLNSFMYQTVGHSVIPLYSECLGTPLYRWEITGSAVQTGRYYDASSVEGPLDETEDLIPLLQEVLRKHPEANAVCSGAILSTYQRTRVESVAVRLGLIPLSYLWQYPALPPPPDRADSLTGLLEDMHHAGCDARIIKIASGGIKESLLWANVADPRTQARLLTGLRPFYQETEFWLRAAVVGEGGEYESLAINGPPSIWRKRIELSPDKDATISGEGGVSYLRLGSAKTVENGTTNESNDLSSVRLPGVFDIQFNAVLEILETSNIQCSASNDDPSTAHNGEDSRAARNDISSDAHNDVSHAAHGDEPSGDTPLDAGYHHFWQEVMQSAFHLTPTHLSISNMMAMGKGDPVRLTKAAEQMKQITLNLNSTFQLISELHHLETELSTSNIVASTLLLKDISNFASVNSVYSELFRPGEPNPPARVTLACGLPDNAESRSYWAPANIGPYSQAICVPLQRGDDEDLNVHDAGLPETVHMAGQIPLIPHTMQLPAVLSARAYLRAAVLSLQHLWRIGQERDVDVWPWGVAFLKQHPAISSRASTAAQVWEDTHRIGTRSKKKSPEDNEDDQEENLDAWDLQYNRFANTSPMQTVTVGEHLHVLPNESVFGGDGDTSMSISPFIAAEVAALPRDASIEWWSLGVTHLLRMHASELRASTTRKDFGWGPVYSLSISLGVQDADPEGYVHMVTVFVRKSSDQAASAEHDLCDFLLGVESTDKSASTSVNTRLEVVHGTAYVSTSGLTDWCKLSRQSLFAKLTIIPCKSVYGQFDFSTDVNDSTEPAQSGGGFGASGQMPTHATLLSAEPTTCQPLIVAMTMRIDSSTSS